MKKLFVITVLSLLTGAAFGQAIQKGNLIGTHVVTVSLMPGVTMEKYVDFFIAKVIPEMEKDVPNMKVYLLKGLRGENMNSYGLIYIFKSSQERDKYYNADGTDTELGKSVNAKIQPVMDELEKLGSSTAKYTDWIVQ
jgi:hypothetical protein